MPSHPTRESNSAPFSCSRHLLARAGYRVVRTQPAADVRVLVDGREERYVVRADALARRRRRLYVVEVKGARGPVCTTAAVRRQLLEYACAFPADGVLLVTARGVVRVAFSFGASGAPRRSR